MRRLAFAAALALLAAGPTAGQAPDTVEDAYRDALRQSPTPLSLKRDQDDWLSDPQARDPEYAADMTERRLAALRRTAGRDLRLRTMAIRGDWTRECVDLGLTGCGTSMGGYMNGPDGARLHWQLQGGATDEDGVRGGVLFMAEGAEGLKPIAWAADAAVYDTPRLVGGEQTYIVVPGVLAGSGGGRADAVFRWSGSDGAPRLTEVDVWSWRDDLARRLPAGLAVWQGVRIDYDQLSARTPLWRPNDGNCCPTGGAARLDFSLEGDRLVLEDVRVEPPSSSGGSRS